jgi:hypothetical protein
MLLWRFIQFCFWNAARHFVIVSRQELFFGYLSVHFWFVLGLPNTPELSVK